MERYHPPLEWVFPPQFTPSRNFLRTCLTDKPRLVSLVILDSVKLAMLQIIFSFLLFLFVALWVECGPQLHTVPTSLNLKSS